MRVRRFVLRLLAVGLTAGWAATAALVLVGYRPGGPIDLLVGLTALLPVAISASAIVWPPVARGRGAYLAIVWLALGAGLVLAPSLGMLAERIAARGPQTLLPSLEVGYPWLLALAATSLFAGLGLARRLLGETALRRRRLVRAVAFALGATVVSASLFAGAAIANDVALRDRPARSSRFGPTDPSAEPPACDGPLAVGPTARVDLRLEGDLDGRSLGAAQLRGRRAGDDFLWLADVATTRSLGQYGAARIGERAWTRSPGRGWHEVPAASVGGLDLDRHLAAVALAPGNRVTAEDHGIEFVEGARSRHCRIAVDGATFEAAIPQVRWFTSGSIRRWRGELDYWVFGDGQLGQVTGSVNGEAVALDGAGVLGTIRVRLTATDRGADVGLRPPLP